jgi:hypothetical protein
MKMLLAANAELYSVQSRVLNLPALVTGLQYTFDVRVVCLAAEAGCCGDVRISLIRMGMPEPLITAKVTMPVSEAEA